MSTKIDPKKAINYADGMKIRELIEHNFTVKAAFSGYEQDPHGDGRWSTVKLSNGLVIRYTAPWFTIDESKEIEEDHLRANHSPEVPNVSDE